MLKTGRLASKPAINQNTSKFRRSLTRFRKEGFFQCMALMGMLFLIIFSYLPMFGIVMSFENFDPAKGFFRSQWVGALHFTTLFGDDGFWLAARNTVILSVGKFIFAFISPLIFALLLNELPNNFFKKFTQTVSYLPNFLSWVIIAGMITMLLSTGQDGILNKALVSLGIASEPIPFLTYPENFWIISILSEVWRTTGYGAILYLAAIATIDHEINESAVIDGAKRLQIIFRITIPMIKDTIIVLLILGIGYLLSGGIAGSNFNQSYLLGNALNMSTSDVLETYILRMGLKLGRFSFAAAAGLLLSVVSMVLIVIANKIVKKVEGEAIF